MRIDTIPQRQVMASCLGGNEPDITATLCDNLDCRVPLELPVRVVAALAIVPHSVKVGTIGPIVPYQGPHRRFEIHCLLCHECLERFCAGEVVRYGSDFVALPKSTTARKQFRSRSSPMTSRRLTPTICINTDGNT